LLYIIVVYISILPGHTCIVVNNPCGLVFAWKYNNESSTWWLAKLFGNSIKCVCIGSFNVSNDVLYNCWDQDVHWEAINQLSSKSVKTKTYNLDCAIVLVCVYVFARVLVICQ
jgi:hypothetical protein